MLKKFVPQKLIKMSQEKLVQIVDSNDRVISTDDQHQARLHGWTVRIARIMVEDESGKKVLLQKRSLNNPLYPGRWDNSAAGHVDEGEDYLTAAKRELYEEIGIKTDDLVEIGEYYNSTKADDYTLSQFNKVYKYITKNTPNKLQKKEVSEVKWFKIEELKRLVQESPELCTNGVIEVVERYY